MTDMRAVMEEYEGDLPARVAKAAEKWRAAFQHMAELIFWATLVRGGGTMPGHEDAEPNPYRIEIDVEYEYPRNRGIA